jgi:quinol monooxygenase YgiN
MRCLSIFLVTAVVLSVPAMGVPQTADTARFAQTADTARYAVAYVEVASSSVAPARTAFTRYRDAIGRESGFASLDVFEQLGRPGHFVLVETWRDQAGFDAHQTAASLTALNDALQPIRISGYDQRPYKTLTIAPARGKEGRNAVVVVSHVDIGGGGQVDVPAMLRKLAETSRAEAGCLRFDVTQHTARANHFTVVEVWEDQQALDRHAMAPHTKQYRDDVQPVAGSPLDERAFRRVE